MDDKTKKKKKKKRGGGPPPPPKKKKSWELWTFFDVQKKQMWKRCALYFT